MQCKHDEIYIVRFDLPLHFVSIKDNAEAIFDLHYTDINKALADYVKVANTGSAVDLIQLIDGEEFCLM